MVEASHEGEDRNAGDKSVEEEESYDTRSELGSQEEELLHTEEDICTLI